MKRGAAVALVLAAVAGPFAPAHAAVPAPGPGAAFSAQTRALAAGDYLAACGLYAPGFLRPLQVLGWEPAQVQQACADQLRTEVEELEPADRAAILGQRVVAVRTSGTRAEVTVERTRYGARVRATGKAVLAGGRWLVSAGPQREHIGRELVLEVPSESMLPTIAVGDTILADQDAYRRHPPALGDIVVLNPPAGFAREEPCAVRPRKGQACARATPGRADDRFLKRIVAGPGDRVSIRDGHVVRNGVRAPEPFVKPCGADGFGCDLPRTITIPAGRWFVMGDNRGASEDSREWGPVAIGALVGRVRRLGPLSRERTAAPPPGGGAVSSPSQAASVVRSGPHGAVSRHGRRAQAASARSASAMIPSREPATA